MPYDLESSLQSAIHDGRFASVDDAMAEAVRLLLLEMKRQPVKPIQPANQRAAAFIGSLHDDAVELDEIVAVAYRERREDTGRGIDVG